MTIVQIFKSEAAATDSSKNAYFPLACVFKKVLAKHCTVVVFLLFLFLGVKQHTIFERTVVAAYNLKNCTMVHYDNDMVCVTLKLLQLL